MYHKNICKILQFTNNYVIIIHKLCKNKDHNKGQDKYITSYREPMVGESLVRIRIYLLSPFSHLIEMFWQ